MKPDQTDPLQSHGRLWSTFSATKHKKMWMPSAIRRRIYQYFFTNGLLVVSDNYSGIHEELECLNIYVYQIGRAFVSRDFCHKVYAWTTAYFVLNDKGINYLRNFFGLPSNVAPLTLQARKADILERRPEGRTGRPTRGRGARGGRGTGQGSFRKRGAPGQSAPAPAEETTTE